MMVQTKTGLLFRAAAPSIAAAAPSIAINARARTNIMVDVT